MKLLSLPLILGFVYGCRSGEAPPGDISMITPFVSSADIASINEGFSASASAPWGFQHNGIDFMPAADLKPFQAVSSGTVEDVSLRQNSASSNWQVNVRIKFNSAYTLEYIFEPFSTLAADGQAQQASVSVSTGQMVSPGDIIGRVRTAGSGAHLHFGLVRSGTAICPDPYFTADARAAILDVMHRTQPTWNMCY